MRGVVLLFLIIVFLILGFRAPFVFVLGYVWASIFTPQFVAYNVVTSLPISLIFAVLSLLFLFAKRSERVEKLRFAQYVLLVFAFWMTVTLLWAERPSEALDKWDPAFKSVVFAALIPQFFGSRRKVELLVWVILISGVAHCIPFGAKVLISGGGYGTPLGLVAQNSGFGEGSTLSMFSIMLIPLCLYLYQHQTIVPYVRLVRWMLIGFIVACLLTSIGTYARTGLISIVVLGLLLLLRTKNIAKNFFVVLLMVSIAYLGVDDGWLARMTTIGDQTESSAMGRVAVWKWVLEYIQGNPWGGSFAMYIINNYSMPLADGTWLQVSAKAYHSIYFEILGETGVPGLFLFLVLIFSVLYSARRISNDDSLIGEPWLRDLARHLQSMLLVYLAGGAFIGVGFQVTFYYIVALSVILINLRDACLRNEGAS